MLNVDMLAALPAVAFPSRSRAWRVFAVSAGLAITAAIVFVAWLHFRFGGDQVTTAVSDIGQAVAALIAAASCAFAARRSAGQLRLAWALLAASAASWGLGEVVWSVYEVGMGIAVPFPSAADVGFLGAIPFAIAGILAFADTPRGTSTGIRLWLDRAIVALSLLFVGWGLGLSQVYFSSGSTLSARLIGLAYPVGDILIGTVLIMAIRRSTQEQQGRLFLLLGGLAANSLADSAFAYLTASGAYATGGYLDAGWVVGYLMVALAAIWPSGVTDRTAEETTIDVWQLTLPWVAVLAAGLTAIARALTGHPMDTVLTLIVGTLAALLMVTQVLAHRESLSLLIKSRTSAATLNDVIVHAPLGIIRIAPDMTIIQANPRGGSLLLTPSAQGSGARMDHNLPSEETARITGQLRSLANGKTGAVEFDSQAMGRDGTAQVLHWSVTAVRKASGAIDYFIAMLEDVSARRQAEAAAMANLAVLERLNKLKSEFLTKVSHEFRTALVGIQGFSEFMRDAEMLEVGEVKSFADEIYNDARRLDATLNEMLALDRAETGRTGLQISQVDLNDLATKAIASTQAETQRHFIKADLNPAVPSIAGDADKLSQVLTALLHNAIEYSPNGGDILVASVVNSGQAVEISVADDGVGLPADFDQRLAGRYTRAPHSGSVSAIGRDVGLPIARQIVEMHGGRLWFESRKGAGTRFHFTVPVENVRTGQPTG